MSEYDFDIQDDLNVDENYKEVDTTPRPPLPGNYVVKVSNWGFAKKFGTEELQLWKDSDGNPRYPLIRLGMVEIVDPFEYGRKVGLFQDIPTAPVTREGGKASPAADVLRSINDAVTARNTGEVIAQLTEALGAGLTFKARLDYVGYDKEFANSEIAKHGGKDNLDKKELNKIYSAAKVRGYRKIQQQNVSRNGGKLPLHKWIGPSGNTIDVKPELTIFFPSSDESVRLGPDKAVTS